MKILLTGGAGYIGSYLAGRLLDRGFQVRVFDRLIFGMQPIQDLTGRSGFELVQGDLRRLTDFPELCSGIDAIIHLAAISNDPSSELDPDTTRLVNLDATIHLAETAKALGIRRFVFASSCSVYGKNENALNDEDSWTEPISPYSESKLLGERGILALSDSTFCPVILRLGTVFGLSRRMRFDLAVNQMTSDAFLKGRVTVSGDGNQWRPFLHVRDAATAFHHVLLATEDQIQSQVFNVGSEPLNCRIRELAEEVVRWVPNARLDFAASSADGRSYRVSFTKLQARLGLTLETQISDGVREVISALKTGSLLDPDDAAYSNLKMLLRLKELPAVLGGEPSRPTFLPFSQPSLGREEEEEVVDSLRSGWLTRGPKTELFEERFAAAVDSPYAVATSSCTGALHLALAAKKIGAGDEVITSPVTFAATANVVIHQGARLVFADIDDETLNISPDEISRKITERTKAIIPVHMGGNPCDMNTIQAIAAERGISVIEDAAHALGASYANRKIGSISDISCFSFYPIKNITAIEGGMITLGDRDLAEKIRLLSMHGMSKQAWTRYSSKASNAHWEVLYPGFKYNMNDIQAAVGLCQLSRLEEFLESRRRIARLYRDALEGRPEVRIVKMTPGSESSNHLFIILLELECLRVSRDEFIQALSGENIGWGIHFRSLHLHQYYREAFGFSPLDFPKANRISQRIVSLPLYPRMQMKDAECVVSAVLKLLRFYRN